MSTIELPASLSGLASDFKSLPLPGAVLGSALDALAHDRPELVDRIVDLSTRSTRQFARLYVDGRDVTGEAIDTVALRSDSVVTVLSAVAGG